MDMKVQTLYRLKQIVIGEVPASQQEIDAASRELDVRRDRARKAIAVARMHLGKGDMRASARIAFDDAQSCLNQGEYDYAYNRAVDSLRYSIGVFHFDYQELTKDDSK